MRIASVLCLLAAPVAAEGTLTVYAPEYFGSEWGPGPAIKAAFEAECGCTLEYRTGDLLPMLLLEGERTRADVAIGFTTDQIRRARGTGLFAPHGQDLSGLTMPVDWSDETFLPFNYGHTAFVYDEDRVADPPESFEALLDAPDDAYSIILQDPRSSPSGLAMLLWVKAIYGDDAPSAWERLAPKVLTVTPGWSESYGLFTSGEADMVLSYTTSPAYHAIAEDDDTIHAAIFPEGHYLTAELAAKVAGTDDEALADDFMTFILSQTFQSLIPTANWSLPVELPREDWPEGFADLPLPDEVIYLGPDAAAQITDAALAEWRAAFSR